MKVFIVTGEPFPNGMAAVSRIKCYARAIIEGGVECEVVVYRRTEISKSKVLNTEVNGVDSGIPYHYVSSKTIRDANRYIRFMRDKLDLNRAYKYLRLNIKRGDVLFLFMARPIETMMMFMKIANQNGAFCVRDLCELPYVTGVENEKTIFLRRAILGTQFPHLDGIMSISSALMNLAKTYTQPSCKHLLVPIMVDYDYYGAITKRKNNSVPYIFHAGTLSQQKDGILGMIEAFGIAKQKLGMPIKYILTGAVSQSSHPDELRDLISRYDLEDSLEFVGHLNRAQIKKYLNEASLVISNRPKSKQDYYGFSTKLGEYLASGTPLLLTNWGEAVNWLENGKSAYVTEPENTLALANAIIHVFSNPEESRRIGAAGKDVCRKCFDYHNWSKPLVDFLNQLGY